MKLTRASSYAIQAVAHMAGTNSEVPIASHHVAQARGIPERFLLKVLKPLVSVHILKSIKGPNGGYRLAKPPDDISILAIIEAVDGPVHGRVPFTDRKVDGKVSKKIETACKRAAEQIRDVLGGVSISDLLGSKK